MHRVRVSLTLCTKARVKRPGGERESYLLAHGHGGGPSVGAELHGLHGSGSFTLQTALIQDGVEHPEVRGHHQDAHTHTGTVVWTTQPLITRRLHSNMTSRPGSDRRSARGQLGVRPGSDRGQTGTRPGPDRGQPGARPGPDRGQTGVRPGSVGRVRPGPDRGQVRPGSAGQTGVTLTCSTDGTASSRSP